MQSRYLGFGGCEHRKLNRSVVERLFLINIFGMDAERRSGEDGNQHGDLKSMLQELKALTQEWKDNTPSSMAEARRLINLDQIQQQDEMIALSLADLSQEAWDSESEFIDGPFSPVQTFVSSAIDPDTDSFEQRIQKRLQQLVNDIRVAAVGDGTRIDDSVSAAEEVLQDITLHRSQNKIKGKLVSGDEDPEILDLNMFHSASANSISSEEDEDGTRDQELCQICFESTPLTTTFLRIEGCGHRFCKVCIARHAEVRARDDGQNRVQCLHAGCRSTLTSAQLQGLLSTMSFELLTTRLTESAIPEREKVYCPYKECSTLFVKPTYLDTDSPSTSAQAPPSLAVGFVECEFCHRGFCLECAVPWHGDQSCAEYQGSLKNEKLSGDEKFTSLVQSKKWRRCAKCHMTVELTTGCHHMTCRCGHSFCYICGIQWTNGQQCSCKFWDERNL